MVKNSPIQVFYDGACPLCSREMAHYQRRDRNHRVHWIDIAAPDFNAAAFGIPLSRLREVMHVRMPDGKIFTEVRAFTKIWEALPPSPGTGLLRMLLKIPGMMAIAGVFYRLFARNRYRLTGRCTPQSCPMEKSGPRLGS